MVFEFVEILHGVHTKKPKNQSRESVKTTPNESSVKTTPTPYAGLIIAPRTTPMNIYRAGTTTYSPNGYKASNGPIPGSFPGSFLERCMITHVRAR